MGEDANHFLGDSHFGQGGGGGKEQQWDGHPDKVVKSRTACWELGGKGQGQGDDSSTRT